MSLERRLRQHFDAAGSGLPEPDADLDTVMKRGRRRVAVRNGAMAAGTLAIATVAVLGFQGLSKRNIDFAPATPAPPTTSPTPAPSEVVIDTATAEPSEERVPDLERVSLEDLRAAVFAYGSEGFVAYEANQQHSPWGGRVDRAFPDGRGGVVLQMRSQEVHWLPDAGQSHESFEPLDNASIRGDSPDLDFLLRDVEPDGTVIFSTRPTECCEEGQLERFYAAPLEGGEPQLIADEHALESSYIGPVSTAQGRIISSCHLMCALWPWPQEDTAFDPDAPGSPYDPHGGIDGLTATEDGRLIAFLESGQTTDQNNGVGPAVPELVVLEAGSFDERARLPLPVKNQTAVDAVVSVSSDGQRIFASLEADASSVPQLTLLVDGALTNKPKVRQVDYVGVVRWLDPGEVRR